MLKFSTKAKTLSLLDGRVASCKILPQLCFTVSELKANCEDIHSQVNERFNAKLIVRSSTLSEDTAAASLAGKFLSLPNVEPEDIIDAMNKVASSFTDECPDNEILIQPMLTDIIMSGVVFTVDPNTGGNYYIINYDKSGSLDSVTSGEGENLFTHHIFHGHKSGDEYLDRLTEMSGELVALFNKSEIDIEFAFTKSGELFLLQARPLVMKKPVADYKEQQNTLLRIFTFLQKEMSPKPYVKGESAIYGVMPDWNPAEMIGTRPKPLSLSLYKSLITDGIWAYQRDNYGYKNLRGFPLMLDLCGFPYIDTRVSFNSFVPEDISGELTQKLVDYYLDSLAKNPDKHDKVEFDIIFSCYTFDLPDRVKVLDEHGFSKEEQILLSDSLRKLTNNIINIKDGLWIADTAKINKLQKRRETIVNSDLDTISKIYWLLQDCARYGTLPFAGLARAGFVAVLLLKSLVTIGILSSREYASYMGQLSTISSQMASDSCELSRAAFLKKYGHLRPGTYDITSVRYDNAPELYFSDNPCENGCEYKKEQFLLTLNQYEAIQTEMEKHGLKGDVLALFKFIKSGIEGREFSKFVFTKSLSDILELLAKLGNEHGFSREDMAFCSISVIDRLYSSADDVKSVLEHSIADGRKKYAQTLSFSLPPVITKPEDIYAFPLPMGTPNYVTLKETTGDVCIDCSCARDIEGKILLITAADPGYDWIFSHSIKGFVTAFGGVNSHMAIRAGELGIPAVVGAGEKLFNQLKSAKTLRIDCANKKVEIIV